ncbi:unnamed protein product, partial [Adineta steineri]
MSHPNIRTINEKKNNGHLAIHHQRIQDRASAVLDAYDEFDESIGIDLIAHLHKIKSKQIERDIYGLPEDFQKRFGTKSSEKFHQAIQKCIAEINDGVHPAIASVANNIPYKIICDIQQNSDVKEVVDDFFNEMIQLNKHNAEKNRTVVEHISCSNGPLNNILYQMPLSSSENQQMTTITNIKETGDKTASHRSEKENILLETKRKRPTCSINYSSSSFTYTQTDDLEIKEAEANATSLKRKNKLYHPTVPVTLSKLKLKWSIINTCGVGLINKDGRNKCLNICYINSVIQCLSNAAPFVQWLIDNGSHSTCQLEADGQVCSICLVCSIIMNVHPSIKNTCKLFCSLSEASAVPLAQYSTELSSNFIPGQQQDPSEFLVVLLDHMMNCLSSTNSQLFSKYMSSPLHSIFGFNVKSSIKCTTCLCETRGENYESLLPISIHSHSNLQDALTAFFSQVKLDNENAFECSKCKTKTTALKSIELADISPIIFIQLKRFIYDQNAKITRKIRHFVSYPEYLDLMPYVDKHVLQSNQGNHQWDKFIWQLHGVLIHLGDSANNGHVYSHIRSPDGAWYKADDEKISPVAVKHVLANNDSYILCYTKLSEERMNLCMTQANNSSEQPTHNLLFSTPKRSYEMNRKTNDTYSPISVSSVSAVSDFNDDSFTKSARRRNLISNKYSSDIDENDSSYQSILQEDLYSSEKRYIQEKVPDSIELQTQSRIEIIPKFNKTNEYRDDSNQSDASSSSTSSSSKPTPLSGKKYDSFRNQSIKLFTQSTRVSQNSAINMDLPFDEDTEDFEEDTEDFEEDGGFQTQLESSYQFRVQSVHLAQLKSIRKEKLSKKRARDFQNMGIPIEVNKTTCKKRIFFSKQNKTTAVTTNDSSNQSDYPSNVIENKNKESRVDVKYLYILLPYIKRFNGYCALCVRNCTFGVTTDDHNQLLRCMLYCKGRPACPFSCSIIIKNNGVGTIVVTNREVFHLRGKKIARPIRAPVRDSIKKQFANGATVFRVYQEKLQGRSLAERNANNYDNSGKSRSIIRKIKSESVIESLLAQDVDQSVYKLCKQYQGEVNIDGKVKGAIQQISKYPCQIIVYTESSIRLFDRLIRLKNAVLSWDATGGVLQEKSDSPRLLYYELSMTLPGLVTEDTIVPITFMISDAHALINVIHWMQRFKFSHSQIFVGKPFPRPRVVLSDRAQVFLLAALQIWNDESMHEFLHRAYRIVTDKATDYDLQLTVIHACLAHVLIDTRKTINKFIDKQYRELAMWSIALLVNTSTWNEFQNNWKSICVVFLQLHSGEQHISHQHQDILFDKISKIKSDPDIGNAVKSSCRTEDDNSSSSSNSDAYTFAEDEDDEQRYSGSNRRLSDLKKRIILDEEEETNRTNSPFKSVINDIFGDALSMTGVSIDDVSKNSGSGILKWFHYLTKYFMPTLAVWSNLLLGDLTRHRRRLVRSFERLYIPTPEQRTTSISERRMGIIKRIQLAMNYLIFFLFTVAGGQIRIRLDVVLSIIVPDMLSMIEEYTNALLSHYPPSQDKSKNNDSSSIEERRLKPIEERWRQTSKRNHGHYSKGPEQPTLNDLSSSLLASRNDVNDNLKLPNLLPDWINVAIGLILSAGNNSDNHRSISLLSLNNQLTCPLIDSIKTFIEQWLSSAANNTHNISFSVNNFSLLIDNFNDISQQCKFILERILLPFLPCDLIVNKVYSCSTCETTKTIRDTIRSIPVNVLRTGLHLEHDLFAYFAPTLSDLLCESCKKATTRHIEVLKWPAVLMITVNAYKRNVKSRKPPNMFSLAQFSSWISIGLPSSMVYDLVCFCSVLEMDNTELIVRTTKIKKSWSTSINKRLIGGGDQLKRLFAHSRIMIFDRLGSRTEHNFVSALYQCALSKSPLHLNKIPSC